MCAFKCMTFALDCFPRLWVLGCSFLRSFQLPTLMLHIHSTYYQDPPVNSQGRFRCSHGLYHWINSKQDARDQLTCHKQFHRSRRATFSVRHGKVIWWSTIQRSAWGITLHEFVLHLQNTSKHPTELDCAIGTSGSDKTRKMPICHCPSHYT